SDPRDALGGSNRAREQEALCFVAAELFEDAEARLVLDTFGDGAQAERARELDGVSRHREVPRSRQVEDERLVDLECGDRQAREVCDRGVTRTEVVDADA